MKGIVCILFVCAAGNLVAQDDVIVTKVGKENPCWIDLRNDNDITTTSIETGSLKGNVTIESGQDTVPLRCCLVTIKSVTGSIVQTLTDTLGNYSIKPILPGKYTVIAEHEKYGKAQFNGVEISQNKITFQNFQLPTAAETKATKKKNKKIEIKPVKK